MNTITPRKGEPGYAQPPPPKNEEEVHPYPHEMNVMEGSEFLDDAIRTKDQPLEETVRAEEWCIEAQHL
jgi:hypothetical protein